VAGRALILGGGSHAHDFAGNARALGTLLAEHGVEADIVDTPDEAWAALASGPTPDSSYRLFAVSGLRFRMLHERYDAMRAQWRYVTPPAADAAMDRHLAAGGSVLSIHTGCICFDDWDRWSELLGRRWSWNETPPAKLSWHPELGPVEVTPSGAAPFTMIDECYADMVDAGPVEVLATASIPGTDPARPQHQPAVWRRTAGLRNRVAVSTLGHDPGSYADPNLRRLLDGIVDWLLAD
jgi:hypothetical protein